MSTLYIVKYPHEALATPAKPVESFDEDLHTFLDDMAETMYAAGGVGLAANQVDDLRRVIVIDTAGEDQPAQLLEIVNPTILERDGEISWEEGCLSFPELYEHVKRAGHVKVEFFDRNGERKEIEAEGLLGVALQHEIDHVDGVVFIDRISPLNRRLALKKFQKIMARRKAEGIED